MPLLSAVFKTSINDLDEDGRFWSTVFPIRSGPHASLFCVFVTFRQFLLQIWSSNQRSRGYVGLGMFTADIMTMR